MSESDEQQPKEDAASGADSRAGEAERFELPDPDGVEGAKLRRRLFGGYRPRDVESALRSREEQIAELRRDVAALWLAFGQHERTIRDMLVALEQLTGVGVDPPGSRMEGPTAETPATGPSGAAAAGSKGDEIGRQLGDLDQVLVAIEEATQSLERTYHDEIAARDDEGPEQGGDAPSEGALDEAEENEPPDGDPEQQGSKPAD